MNAQAKALWPCCGVHGWKCSLTMNPALKPAASAAGTAVEQVGRVELLEHRRVADLGHRWVSGSGSGGQALRVASADDHRRAGSSRWAAAGSRWSPRTRCSTTRCSISPAARAASSGRGSASSATASGDSTVYVAGFLRAFARRAEASHLALFGRTVDDIEAFVLGAGRRLRRRRQHRQHAADLAGPRRRPRSSARRGRPGSSWPGCRPGRCAGSRAARPIRSGRLWRRSTTGSASSPAASAPHYDGEPERRPLYHRLDRRGTPPRGLRGRRRRRARLPRRASCPRSSRRARAPGLPGRSRGPDGRRSRPSCRRATSARRGYPARSGAARAARVPRADRPDGVADPRRSEPPAPGGLDGPAPARRHEPGRQVGQRREDEQPLGALPRCGTTRSRSRLRRVGSASIERAAGGRSTSRRARPKTSRSRSSSRGPQRSRGPAADRRSSALRTARSASAPVAGSGPAGTSRATTALRNSGWSVTPTGVGRVQPRDAAEPDAGQRREGRTAGRERRRGVADVGPEADVGAHPPVGHGLLDGRPIDSRRCDRSTVRILHPDPPRRRPGPLDAGVAAAGRSSPSATAARVLPAGAADVRSIVRAAGRYTVRGAAPRMLSGPNGRRRPRRPGVGRDPARRRADDRRDRRGRRRATTGAALANNRYSADVVADRRPRRARRQARPRRPTTRCRAGSLSGRVTPSPTSARAGGSRSTSTGRSTLAARRRRPVRRRDCDWSIRDADSLAVRSRRRGSDGRGARVVGRAYVAGERGLARAHTSRPGRRVLVEERGLRTARRASAPPASVLGVLLDRDGPGRSWRRWPGSATAPSSTRGSCWRIGSGPDEARWPRAEDRFASDLLLPERHRGSVAPDLTDGRRGAPIPILLGGHTLVGPGVPARSVRRLTGRRVMPGLRREPPADLDPVGQDPDARRRASAPRSAGPGR